MRWRAGRKVGGTVYLEDELAGMMDSPQLANQVVAALNKQLATEGCKCSPRPCPFQIKGRLFCTECRLEVILTRPRRLRSPTSLESDLLEAARRLDDHAHGGQANPEFAASVRGLSSSLRDRVRVIRAAVDHEIENAGVNEYHAGASDMLERICAAATPTGEALKARARQDDVRDGIIRPRPPAAPLPDPERIYPCADCGTMRSKAEGGNVFTVCDACWDKHHPTAATAIVDATLASPSRLLDQIRGTICGCRRDYDEPCRRAGDDPRGLELYCASRITAAERSQGGGK